ncbi:L,D-transpeptidase family protein [Shewanella kaireitica]|uniref:L,D-transpeptidase family protein n=1 Tax=Shewanella kaireitica TaxID=212021 RepID=UPI00200C1B20|nr:L,D-transpeptidase family protein [Shewanella kaireitica]MCL1095271.1 L,D-transpeptidase family protein [Shewanella kaireitica]
MAKDLGVNLGEGDINAKQFQLLKGEIIERVFSQREGYVNRRELYLTDMSNFEKLVAFTDSDKQIQRLRFKIRQYKKLSQYKWPHLQPNEFQLGQKAKDIAKLRWMLTELDDLEVKNISAYREQVYDPSITRGIKHFQKRHGFIPDGELTVETIKLLNVNPNERLIELQRALQYKISKYEYQQGTYIEVNIADFKLRIKGDDLSKLELPIIVGRINNKTPLLNTHISKITVNPTWTPPNSILYDELLLALENDADFLVNERFVLVNRDSKQEVKSLKGMTVQQVKRSLKHYQLVQTAGYWNALGKYRFTIPNSQLIFLHDTPNKKAFLQRNRALSHGCIRIAQPELLANYLIKREQSYSRNRLSVAKQGTKTVDIKLKRPIPIVITNQNVWVDKDNVLQVRANVYNREVTE